jgi:hypothetical protein
VTEVFCVSRSGSFADSRISTCGGLAPASDNSRSLDERCVRFCRKLRCTAPLVLACKVKLSALTINCYEMQCREIL